MTPEAQQQRPTTAAEGARANIADSWLVLQARFEALLSCERWMVLALRPDMAIEFCNPAYATFVGRSIEELEGRNLLELFPAFAGTQSFMVYQQVLATNQPCEAEGWIGKRCMRAHVRPAPWGLIVFAEDITEQKNALEAAARGPTGESLKLEEERYKLVLEVTRDVLWEWDLASDRARFAGPLREMLKWPKDQPDPRFSEIKSRTHPEDKERVQQTLRRQIADGKPCEDVFRVQRCDGKWIWVESRGRAILANGKPWRHIGSLRDVTESLELREQLQQSQKMESIGRLAGGIAHDFNNVLTAILGFATRARQHVSGDPEALSDIDRVLAAGERAAKLTRQLLGFARKQAAEPRQVDLNRLIQDMHSVLLLREDIELRFNLAPDLFPICIDPTQFEQVLLNLAVNAKDAMPRGGRLEISTANVVRGNSLELPSGEFVRISVSDNGVGMNEEVKSRLFEPYFTTKDRGKGTGLGLATCYGIVKQNGGDISVESAPGRGTTFSVLLPRAVGRERRITTSRIADLVPKGTETILVADDDALVAQLAGTMLGELGYQVLTAGNGEEALAILGASKVDLVLSDLRLPGMNGRQLIEAVRRTYPDVGVLLMSGAADECGDAIEDPPLWLGKPFSLAELAQKVRDALVMRKT